MKKYWVRYTENPERDMEYPVSFFAVHEDSDYLQSLDPDAEIISAFDGMWGISAGEGLCGYGPFGTVAEAEDFIADNIGDDPWFDLPAVIFSGCEAGTNILGDDLFIPMEIVR